MKFLTSLLSLSATTMAVAISSTYMPTVALDSPLDGYTVNGTLTWIGAIEEGGPEYTFSGTAQSILAQILEVNPNYNANQTAVVEKRNQGKIICNVGGSGAADPSKEKSQASYLRSLGNGRCHVGAGPSTCVRVSCSYGAGVWLCNDNTYAIDPSCAYLADYVDAIISDCEYGVSRPCAVIGCVSQDVWLVHGQQFDTDKYNVIIGAANC